MCSVPKPLLPIHRVPLLTRWLRLLSAAAIPLSDVFVIGNAYNYQMLLEWASTAGLPAENIVNDGSTNNETRLGAVKDLDLLLSQPALVGDATAWSGLLVIGGDTLFYPDFSLSSILHRYRESPGASLLQGDAPAALPHFKSQVLYYLVEDTRKNGILEVDEASQLVTSFMEKPLPNETESRRACPCFYILSRPALERVHSYVAAATSLVEVDAPGNLLRHLIALNTAAHNPALLPIEAQRIGGRFDIGGLDTYVQCDEWFRKQEEGSGADAEAVAQQ